MHLAQIITDKVSQPGALALVVNLAQLAEWLDLQCILPLL